MFPLERNKELRIPAHAHFYSSHSLGLFFQLFCSPSGQHLLLIVVTITTEWHAGCLTHCADWGPDAKLLHPQKTKVFFGQCPAGSHCWVGIYSAVRSRSQQKLVDDREIKELRLAKEKAMPGK